MTTSVSARGTRAIRADSLGWDQKLAKRFRLASAGGGGVFLPAQSTENSPPQEVNPAKAGLVPRAADGTSVSATKH
jgi:hypothetical protein